MLVARSVATAARSGAGATTCDGRRGPRVASAGMAETRTAGRLGRALERMRPSRDVRDAYELQAECLELGATPIAALPDRCRATIAGTLRTVTLRPVGGVPALEAELYDGSGLVTLVWLGRRRIAAVTPGRWLTATGLVAEQDGRRLMFNPRYELRAADHG